MSAATENDKGNRRLLATRFTYGGIGFVVAVFALLTGKGLITPNGGNPNDSPITIRGGSIHFKAKKSEWQPCSVGSTTCYMAASAKADKKKLKYFHFIDVGDNDIPVQVNAAASGVGWEIDVLDGNKQVIRVCAEIFSPTTCDNTNPIKSDYVYVINTGSGRFDPPVGLSGKENLLVYENSSYAYITTIQLNVSDGSEMDKTCNYSDCSLYLSQK